MTCSVGGLPAVLWQWASDGLPLPQAKAPPTVARGVIPFGPEPCQRGSGSFALRMGGGGSQEWAVALLGSHTPSKNPSSFIRVQAYFAYLGRRAPRLLILRVLVS